MNKLQRGFTLIELMVVIVIIGILSALAVPKMFGTSAKAKAAEAPGVISNWETLQSAYGQENSLPGTFAQIGFQQPGTVVSPTESNTTWFKYTDLGVTGTATDIEVAAVLTFGECITGDTFTSNFNTTGDVITHGKTGTCAAAYTPNF